MMVDEMKKRGWNLNEVGRDQDLVRPVANRQERNDGALDSLTKAGSRQPTFSTARRPRPIPRRRSARPTSDHEEPAVQRRWITFGLNDEAALGSVRALEGKGFKADSVISVGIGGSASA